MTRSANRKKVGLLAVAAAVASTLALAAPASAASVAPTPITVHVMPNKITYSGAHTRAAGRFRFTVETGDHKDQNTLVLLSLRAGYSIQQAQHDVTAVMSASGPADPKLVRRIDTRIIWWGGTFAPGQLSVILPAGHYVLIDEAPGNAMAELTVTGSLHTLAPYPKPSAGIYATSRIHGDRFDVTRTTLPADGWVSFTNKTDEPHFVSLQHVRSWVTDSDVAKGLSAATPPSWTLSAEYDGAPISPGHHIRFSLHLPPGKYLLTCWWPDAYTGMPHALMGMWRLITVT